MNHTRIVEALFQELPEMSFELASRTGIDPHLYSDREIVILEILDSPNLRGTRDLVLPLGVGAGGIRRGAKDLHRLINAIGHLSGRYIGRRPGIELDLEAVMKAAAATGTAIEINGALQRLDATPEAIRIGIDDGVTFVIDTDSHHPSELGRMEYGVLNAQRGWVEEAMVANTWPTTRFLKWVARKRG